ncbi:MAG: ATP-binding protein [Candidatus Saccharibacteria bacterium]
MTPFQVSSLITAILSIILSIGVFSSDRKGPANRLWAFTTFLLGLWSTGLLGVVSSKTAEFAMIWQYVLDGSAILIPISFFVFVVYLIQKEKEYRRAVILSWVFGACLFAVSFTPLFKTGLAPKFDFPFWIVPGPLYLIFPVAYVSFVFIALAVLLRTRMATTDLVLKRQLSYVLMAQIFGFGGGLTNFFPQIMNVYPVGNYFIALYIFFISYSILKHNLFNLKVIATELLVYALCIFLMARVLLDRNTTDKMFDGLLLLVVLLFGFLLISSVRREVSQREKLQELTERLQKANQDLESLDKARAEFISIASHQLRTPPATIKWYLAAVLTGDFGPLEAKVKEALKKAEYSNNSLISLIDDLLNVSRIERGKMEFIYESGDLVEIVKAVVQQLQPQADAKKIRLTFTKPARKVPKIVMDKEKLKQVINNLVDNGIKYSDKGRVSVSMEIIKGQVYVRVKDQGKGIKPEEIDDIFSKFKRGSGSVHHSAGLGLGLYVAKVIVEHHNGALTVESEGENKGSTFIVRLPVKSDLKNEVLDLTKQFKQ